MVQSIEIEAPRRPELTKDEEASRLPIPLFAFVNSLRHAGKAGMAFSDRRRVFVNNLNGACPAQAPVWRVWECGISNMGWKPVKIDGRIEEIKKPSA